MNVKTKMKMAHSINHTGLTKLKAIFGENADGFIESVIMLENSMDDGYDSIVVDTAGNPHYFVEEDFDKVYVI
jgi:hypothetical protein